MIAGSQQINKELRLLLDEKSVQAIYEYFFIIRDDQTALSSALKAQNAEGQNPLMLLLQGNDYKHFFDLWPYIGSCRSLPQVLTQLDNTGQGILHYAAKTHDLNIMHTLINSINNHIGAASVRTLYQGSANKLDNILINIAASSTSNTAKNDADIFKEVIRCYKDFFGLGDLCTLIFTPNSSADNALSTAIQYENYDICYTILQTVNDALSSQVEVKDFILNIYGGHNIHGYSALMLAFINYHSTNTEQAKQLCYKFINFIEEASSQYHTPSTSPSLVLDNSIGEFTVQNTETQEADSVINKLNKLIYEQIIKCTDKDGNHALMMLIILQMNELFTSLLNLMSTYSDTLKAAITTCNSRGDNILMLSVRTDNTSTLKSAAELTIKQLGNEELAKVLSIQAFDIAVNSGNDEIIKLVTEYLKVSGLYQQASASGQIDNFLTARNQVGETPLMRAINANDIGTCDVIMNLAKDANKLQKILMLSSTDKSGNTPVTIAETNQEIAKIIEEFADSNDIGFYLRDQLHKMKKIQEYNGFLRKIRGY